MSDAPTTWRSTPICATDAMIEAGAVEVREYCLWHQWPEDARQIAREVYAAMVNAAPKPPAVRAWQDIASAPKDGTPIMGWNETIGVQQMFWGIHYGGEWVMGVWDNIPGTWYPHPKLWQPLPEPPATGDANG